MRYKEKVAKKGDKITVRTVSLEYVLYSVQLHGSIKHNPMHGILFDTSAWSKLKEEEKIVTDIQTDKEHFDSMVPVIRKVLLRIAVMQQQQQSSWCWGRGGGCFRLDW